MPNPGPLRILVVEDEADTREPRRTVCVEALIQDKTGFDHVLRASGAYNTSIRGSRERFCGCVSFLSAFLLPLVSPVFFPGVACPQRGRTVLFSVGRPRWARSCT
jgi:hypothetical protein